MRKGDPHRVIVLLDFWRIRSSAPIQVMRAVLRMVRGDWFGVTILSRNTASTAFGDTGSTFTWMAVTSAIDAPSPSP